MLSSYDIHVQNRKDLKLHWEITQNRYVDPMTRCWTFLESISAYLAKILRRCVDFNTLINTYLRRS